MGCETNIEKKSYLKDERSVRHAIHRRDTILTVGRDRVLIVIAPCSPPIARDLSPGDRVIKQMSSVGSTRPICKCDDVSQKVTKRPVEHAINLPCLGIAMHEWKSLFETGHSETVEPVDASNCLILLLDTTKMWLLDHRRPLLQRGITVTGLSTSNWPSLLSQTRTDPFRVPVAIRSPLGENLAVITQCLCWSVRIFWPLVASQIVAMQFEDPETSFVESGEKSTA